MFSFTKNKIFFQGQENTATKEYFQYWNVKNRNSSKSEIIDRRSFDFDYFRCILYFKCEKNRKLLKFQISQVL